MINILTIPIIVIAAISIYVGAYHLFIFIKRKDLKENLYFSFCCFSVGIYTFLSFQLYNADNFIDGLFWQKLQFAAMCLLSLSVLWFVGRLLSIKSYTVSIILSVIYSILFILGLTVSNELTLSLNARSLKIITLGKCTLKYFELEPGLIYQVQFFFFLISMLYIIFIFFKYSHNYPTKYRKYITISVALFFLGVLNDIFVSSGIYVFIYIAEYTYVFIILTMAFILLNGYADLYTQIEELNISLEHKIEDRTKEIRKAYKKIENLAYEDSLTKLPNRRDILNKIQQEKFRLEREKIKKTNKTTIKNSFCIAVCDIDYFKKVNDTYGHDCGDMILSEFGKRIRKVIRKLDQIGRWGGEEFIILFPDTDLSGGKIISEKIRKFLESENFYYNDIIINITVTIGLTACKDNDKGIDECIKEADIALYKGKSTGRNRIIAYKD